MTPWIEIKADSDFSIHNIPVGIISYGRKSERIASRIGDYAIDLSLLDDTGLFDQFRIRRTLWRSKYLNDFIALGKETTSEIRRFIQDLLVDKSVSSVVRSCLIPINKCKVHLPIYCRDYTDFYSSYHHAFNVGVMFRDPENAILPNWKHIPIGYHGRASTIVIDGTEIHRPVGQTMGDQSAHPTFGPSRLVDFELEMAFIVGKENKLGEAIPIDDTHNYIFGMVLFNDWSARDIQKWEYVPLGPFLSKSFASTMSPWVVCMEALAPYKKPAPEQDPAVLPYLRDQDRFVYDINLSVGLTSSDGVETIVSRSNAKNLYWSVSQQLAHHTINGCQVNIGDMMASGTISGAEVSSYGSMLELSWGGKKDIVLNNGETRKFVQDNDTITLRGFAQKDDKRVGFGQAAGKVLPAKF